MATVPPGNLSRRPSFVDHGETYPGIGLMDAAVECRQAADRFLTLARQMTRVEDKAVMIGMATVWMERADPAERDKHIVPKQQT
jgi:hypothetical protein